MALDNFQIDLLQIDGAVGEQGERGDSPPPEPDKQADRAREPRAIDKTPVDVGWQRGTKRCEILFVDDDDSFLALCERQFADTNYSIRIAGSARQALDILAGEQIDVLVSDMCMPGTSGTELMEQVQKKHPAVIRVIISGKFDVHDTIEAINKGHIHGYLVKPFNDRDVKLMLYRVLLEKERREAEERRRQERQNNVKRRAKELGEAVVQAKKDVQRAYDEAVDLLASLAGDGDDGDEVADIALELASRRGVREELRRQIGIAARLRNLGRLMDGDENNIARRSARLTAGLTACRTAAAIIAAHDERMDGSGQPLGLKGSEIPVAARILGLAEDYVQLRRKERLTHDQAMAELDRCRARYDPAFLGLLAALPVNSG